MLIVPRPSIIDNSENRMHFFDLPFQEHIERGRAAQPSVKLREKAISIFVTQ